MKDTILAWHTGQKCSIVSLRQYYLTKWVYVRTFSSENNMVKRYLEQGKSFKHRGIGKELKKT